MNLDQNTRKDVQNAYEKQSLQLDNIIVSIASGTIVLTITFVEKIVNNQNADCSWVLKLSWLFLIICVTSVLLSYRMSITNFENALRPGGEQSKLLDSFVNITNYIAIIALIIGLMFAIAFGWLSIDSLAK